VEAWQNEREELLREKECLEMALNFYQNKVLKDQRL